MTIASSHSATAKASVHVTPNDVVLLTGATGYIGGRLLERLLQAGHSVRCMARNPANLGDAESRGFHVVKGDVLDIESLRAALTGVTTAFYLVHSMGAAGGFEEADRVAAGNFAAAAAEAGVEKIVYLGGLGGGEDLSPHLASRQEVGRILRDGEVPTIELRASIIIGSGSLSFEMIRALVRRLPIMTTPRWVRSLTQPISVEDVLAYCLASIDKHINRSVIYEIGGPDRVSYSGLMREYARQRGLRRLIVPVPLLSPGLSSLWLGLVTPLYARIGRKLIDSVKHDTVVEDDRALRDFDIKPRGVKEAIARALANEDRDFAQTRWSDAVSSAGEEKRWGGKRFGSRLLDLRRIESKAPPQSAFAPIRRIGGKTGWYYATFLWRIRGFLDLLVGGVGLRRGRRDPEHLRVGDSLDFWRVEAIETDRLLRLRAEMKVPGRAWLQFEVKPDEASGGSLITQTAIFDPAGVFGVMYWYALWPVHQFVFAGMLRRIARAGVTLR